ncbi:MAG: DUF4127 family protein [Bacilli bacterium]
MVKIVYIPLDERPCNYQFPTKIFNQKDVEIITPPQSIMGYKKQPTDIDQLSDWLMTNTKQAYGLVVALDTLLYGGIVPSRLHQLPLKILLKRLQILKKLKKQNPELQIFGFQLIMRCPQYNSADEEPEYFKNYGKSIHMLGYYSHMKELGILPKKDQEKLNNIFVPQPFLDDFVNRRKVNQQMNIAALKLVSEGIISFFTFPQDDSSKFGWTAKDQIVIRKSIKKRHLMHLVYMYPGADEAGSVLVSRMVCQFKQVVPKVLIRYPGPSCAKIIPSIEDRYLDTMVKYHVLACGGIIVDSLKECDAVAFINAPADYMRSSFSREAPKHGLEVLRNMVEAMEFLDYARHQNKVIIIGDITYGNGSDLEIFHLLSQKQMTFDLAGFGGWNTASNAIGQAIAMGFSFLINGCTESHLNFLVSRYIEDICYCGYVRQIVMKNFLPKHPQLDYFNVMEKNGLVAQEVARQLNLFIKKNMPQLWDHGKIIKVELPWKRMYEIDLEAIYQEDNKKSM